jgi:hypothetical protein
MEGAGRQSWQWVMLGMGTRDIHIVGAVLTTAEYSACKTWTRPKV